jgi:hypothetical protein
LRVYPVPVFKGYRRVCGVRVEPTGLNSLDTKLQPWTIDMKTVDFPFLVPFMFIFLVMPSQLSLLC